MKRILFTAVVLIGSAAVSAQPASTGDQQLFASPRAAADALLAACKDNDSAALTRMLGKPYGEQLKSIDDAEERQHRLDFYNKAQARLDIEEKDGQAIIVVGREQWPVPIPLVKEAGGWRFDTAAGMQELLARRIGENELAIIDVCYDYLLFQSEYAAVDRDGDEVREYAQRFLSTEGKRDGLFWKVDEDAAERPSPMAAVRPYYGDDLSQGASGRPYMGYHFKILTKQGEHPPGGKYDYIINGNMIAGFALVAWPADYRKSGVMTFVISHQGKLLQKDLGPDTAKRAEAMTEYNPDATWTPVQPEP